MALVDGGAGKQAATLNGGTLKALKPPMSGRNVIIDAIASGGGNALAADLRKLGMKNVRVYGRIVSGRLPVDAIADLEALSTLRIARPAFAGTNAGIVTSQGDAAQMSDVARSTFGVDGSGVRIGVLSDSYDCLGGAAQGIADDDLPSDVIVLEDGPCPASDEGRGMMELIHDAAPGAGQAFHTAFNGQADFALGIFELMNDAGSDIIVDDVIYFAEPMFQDGFIAQAIDFVKARGVTYFSSAGNNARSAYQSAFRSSGVPGVFGGDRHDFDPGPAVDDLMTITLATGTTIFSFQWTEPFFSVTGGDGSPSDLDIVLYNPDGSFLGIGGFSFNVGGDAVEVFGIVNNGPPAELQIGLELFEGPAPQGLKFVYFNRFTTLDEHTDFNTITGSLYGHANAQGAIAVGAARYDQTPPFGVDPPTIESFSSAGQAPIFFNTQGQPHPTPIIRKKPEIVGPNGGNTTFFGFDYEGDGFPNFFGTSASAPHAAAVAALMLEANGGLSPNRIRNTLQNTALDMDDPFTPGFDTGFDYLTGYGLIDAVAAVGHVAGASKDEIVADGTTPKRFTLNGNYPNPFNPTTTISFEIPDAQQVQLLVFDLLGRQVATLVDGVLDAGQHDIQWDARTLPSGQYFYHLRSGDFQAQGQMTLLK